MSFKTFCSFTMVCMVVSTMPFSSVVAQQGAGIPGIKPAAVATEMSDEEIIQKASYLLGFNAMRGMATELKARGITLSNEQVLEGARKALAGEEVGVPMAEIQMVMEGFQKKVQEQQKIQQAKMMADMKKAADENKAKGDAFMAENAKKDGVKTLNGIQYEILKEGTGPIPSETDRVRINYHGMLLDGTVFDSTTAPPNPQRPAKPYDSAANAFVPGFNTAIQAMPVGSKWKIVIPPNLAYGMQGPGGPNQTLIFEVELLEILAPTDGAPSDQ